MSAMEEWGSHDDEFGRAIRSVKPLLKFAIPVAVILWLLSGIYIVDPDEQGVVRRFGKAVRVASPGPHYHLPQPFEKANTVKIKAVKRLEMGFRTIPNTSPARYHFYPDESLMLTGDEQIVDAQFIVQYQVKDAEAYLFNVRGLEARQGALRDAAEVALRQVVGKRPIDDVLIGEKLQIEIEISELLQRIIDKYVSGLSIGEVKLQTVQPPKEIAAAFSDVVSAKEDKDRLIKEAQGFSEDIIPKARGKAQRLIREAEGYKQQRIKRAEGDTSRFLAVLTEYEKARDVTRKRLYLETMEQVLPGIRKFIIDSDAGGNVLQFLPLEQAGGVK